ncbi:hypothetical protein [Reticulibacter mediterranei]|nr:hypothetical protein [Reticulibacter mediterranei]
MQMRPMPEDGSIFQPVHSSGDMQRSVSAERGSVASQQQRMDPQRSGGMVRRPLRTVPLIPLEGASGISTHKESAQAVWEYAGETGGIEPIAPSAPTSASVLDGANDDFIQPEMQTGEWLQYKMQGYQHTDEPEIRRTPNRKRRPVRTDSAMQQAEPTAIILPTTTPLYSPYDRPLPSWELRRKRDTIFMMLLTLLVLGILGIMSCNYLLSLYHI